MSKITFLFLLLVTPFFAFSQAANDECIDATPITVLTASSTSALAEISMATESLDASCDVTSNDNLDVWFSFNMPVDGNINLTGVNTNYRFSLYTSCGGPELACRTGSGFIYSLDANQDYILRIARASAQDDTFSIQAFEEIANDECVDRISIDVEVGSQNTYGFDSRGATESLDASCNTVSYDNLDAWYEFTMPVDGNVRITNLGSVDIVSLYDSCGGTELDCFVSNGYFFNLDATATYVLRLSRRSFSGGVIDFNIEAFETISNDECVDRLPINVEVGTQNTYEYDSRAATESLDASCNTVSYDNQDVWYEFTMPVDGNVRVTSLGSVDIVTLYDSCGGVELDCFGNNGYFFNLDATSTYVLRLSKRSFSGGVVDFTVEAFEEIANDECEDRILIDVEVGTINTYEFDSRAATESLDASCNTVSYDNQDVWYEFTMPVDGNVRVTSLGSVDIVTLYDGCGGTELDCFNNNGFLFNLDANTTYVLRLSRRSFSAEVIDFNVEAFETIANDECVDRIPITVEVGTSNSYEYDPHAATESLDASCNTVSYDNLDVWYEFEMPVDGNVRATSLSSIDVASIYDSCGGVELACITGNDYFYALEGGVTYILRLSRRSFSAEIVNFTLEAFEELINDECDNAISIAVGVVAPATTTVEFRAATESLDASCNTTNYDNLDAWYQLTMPVTGNLEITGGSSLNIYSLYDGCGGTELECQVGNGTFFGLTGGITYLFRTSRRSFSAETASFNLQALEAPLSPCAATAEWISGAWLNGIEPDATTNAIIRSNYNTSAHGSIICCSLSIDSGTTLTVSPGDFVDVSFNVDVSGTLDILHEGSLVQRDGLATATNNGTIRVRKTTPFLKPRDFMIMGSPMTEETRDGVYNDAFLVLKHNTTNFVPNPDVEAQFPFAENFADDNGNNWQEYTGDIDAGEGYLVRPQSSYTDGNKTYDLVYDQGTLNNGDITFPVLFNNDQNDSPNVFGNPYASAILADDFINANPMVDALYFWEHLTSPNPDLPGYGSMNFSMEDLSMYNLTGGIAAASDITGTATKPNGFISSAQGFAVKANAAGTAIFTNSMRRLGNNNTWRRPASSANRLWLRVSNDMYDVQNTTLIGFLDTATPELDAGYDSKRLANIVSLYTKTEYGEQLAIQARETFDPSIKIPLGFSSLVEEQLQFTISIHDIEGPEITETQIYLIDLLLNELIDLTQEDYSFISGPADVENRFTIVFQEEILGANTSALEGLVLYPNPASNVLFLGNVQRANIEEVSIYDLSGRLVQVVTVSESNKSISIDISALSSAPYMLKLKSSGGELVRRFIKE